MLPTISENSISIGDGNNYIQMPVGEEKTQLQDDIKSQSHQNGIGDSSMTTNGSPVVKAPEFDAKEVFQMATKKVIHSQRMKSLIFGIELKKYESSFAERESNSERKALLESISWLSNHIPERVVVDLNNNISEFVDPEFGFDEDKSTYDRSSNSNDESTEGKSSSCSLDTKTSLKSSVSVSSNFQELTTDDTRYPITFRTSSFLDNELLRQPSRKKRLVKRIKSKLMKKDRSSLSISQNVTRTRKFLGIKMNLKFLKKKKDHTRSIEVDVTNDTALPEESNRRTARETVINSQSQIDKRTHSLLTSKKESLLRISVSKDKADDSIPPERHESNPQVLPQETTINSQSRIDERTSWLFTAKKDSLLRISASEDKADDSIPSERHESNPQAYTHKEKSNNNISVRRIRRSRPSWSEFRTSSRNQLALSVLQEDTKTGDLLRSYTRNNLVDSRGRWCSIVEAFDNDIDDLKSSQNYGDDDEDYRKYFKNHENTFSKKRRKLSDGLPLINRRESVLLFVDISGFTKLSTLVALETLSAGINSYFQIITDEINSFGGDILKFAGDAVFAEWNISADPLSSKKKTSIEACVTLAANCGAKLVSICTDFPIFASAEDKKVGKVILTLNIHCGIGVGKIMGAHVGNNSSNREFIILGGPIDQVAEAEARASLGEFVASPEIMRILSETCIFSNELNSLKMDTPQIIAKHSKKYFTPLDQKKGEEPTNISIISEPKKKLDLLCKALDTPALKQLRKLVSLYVHPVVVDDDEEQFGTPKPKTARERIHAEAELREVYVLFITPLIDTNLTGNDFKDQQLIDLLNDIFLVTIRELDYFKGHLRQFIVDDKGVVLIATFGLRGSTCQNMISNRALPATRAIHKVLLKELNVESRIGATVGDVYCGIVGGLQRHEYAVLGPSVNLAARLMASPRNPGILVDNAVRLGAGKFFVFNALEPVTAKGYAKLVRIFEPVGLSESKWKKIDFNFVGREVELKLMLREAKDMLLYSNAPKFFLITGDALIGKSSFLSQSLESIRTISSLCDTCYISIRHVNHEEEAQVPLSAFRSIFREFLNELTMDYDGDHYPLVTESKSGSDKASEIFKFICHEIDAPPKFEVFIENFFLNMQNKYPPQSEQFHDWDLIVTYLARIICYFAEKQNLIVIAFDDVQNMDKHSWNLLQKIFEEGSNVMIAGTKSTPATSPLRLKNAFRVALNEVYKPNSQFFHLTIPPMKDIEVQNVCANYLKDFDIGEDLLNNVITQSNGIPGLAVQMIDTIKRISVESGTRRTSLLIEEFTSHSISDIFMFQMDSLEPGVRNILQLGAVLGTTFNLKELVMITEQWQNIEEKNESARFEHAKSVQSILEIGVKEHILDELLEGEGGEVENEEKIGLYAENSQANLCIHPYEDINRSYGFCHEMWREKILDMMLESRKQEIQERIAATMSEIRARSA